MVFKRREKLGFWARLRELAAPRKGWSRGFRYIGRRVQRLPDTPHRIALGFACGAFASFTPLFTLHALVAVALAWGIRANIIASIFGTIVGNPISFGFIAYICMTLGNWILGRADAGVNLDEKLTFEYVSTYPADFLVSIFVPYLIGGLIPGALAGLAAYILIKPAIARFQKRRRDVLADRARTLLVARGGDIDKRRKALAEAGASDGPNDGASGGGGREGGGLAATTNNRRASGGAQFAISGALAPKRPRSAT